MLKLILSKQPELGVRCKDGKTPLHYAVSSLGQNETRDVTMVEEIVWLLLEGGANPNETSNKLDKLPCLSIASQYGSAGLVKMLLKHGASVHECNHEGQNALHAAFGNISGTITSTIIFVPSALTKGGNIRIHLSVCHKNIHLAHDYLLKY